MFKFIRINFTLYFTGFWVAQDARGDNLSAGREQIKQILAGHVFRQTSNIQISAFDRVTAWSR